MIKSVLRYIYWNVIRHVQVHMILYDKYGQRKSFKTRRSIDKDGMPLPWYTFPAIEYLNQFDFRKSIVFEYGAGHSTLYWSGKVEKIISVESYKRWYEIISKCNNDNLNLILHENKDDYVESISNYSGKYDIIAVDGVYRLLCVEQAIKYLNDDGMIIIDNSDRHPNCTKYLRDNNYYQIDFSGFGPINNYSWTTSIFIQHSTNLQENFRNPLPIGGLGQTEID